MNKLYLIKSLLLLTYLVQLYSFEIIFTVQSNQVSFSCLYSNTYVKIMFVFQSRLWWTPNYLTQFGTLVFLFIFVMFCFFFYSKILYITVYNQHMILYKNSIYHLTFVSVLPYIVHRSSLFVLFSSVFSSFSFN